MFELSGIPPVARFEGLDAERQQASEAQVRAWCSAQELPFPTFTGCLVHLVLVNKVKLSFIQLLATDSQPCSGLMSENRQ
jgi:hypothetical protein